jgi:hypothetical protein
LRFTKTLISAGVAVAALSLLATAAPAMADAGPLVPFPIATTVAPGTTGPMMFAFQNSGTDGTNFNAATAGSIANPSTVTFQAPAHTTFPDQATVQSQISTNNGATFGASSLATMNCVVSNAGSTLTCGITNPPNGINGAGYNTGTPPGAVRAFSPLVTVDATVAAGTVLTGGSGTFKLYNYQGTPVGYTTGISNQPLLTTPPAPGAPIYNEDGSVDIPGTGTPGATITVKDAAGAVIATTTVNPDGTYDVKLPAAQAGTVTVTESDMPGASWPVTIAADLLGTPIVNPLIAGGAALALVAGLGTVVLIRRRKAAVEA